MIMASAVIHICVAKKVNELLKRNAKEFLLGSIAPDISKQVGQERSKSHYIYEKNSDLPHLEVFLHKYGHTLKENDFDLGYYCHLFTDLLWFGNFMPKYCSNEFTRVNYLNGEEKKLTHELVGKLIYNDYTNLNIKLIEDYDLDLSLFYEECPVIKSPIEEIPIDKLQVIVDKMGIIIENSKKRDTIIFDNEDINKFIDETASYFINNLKVLGIIE